MVWGVQPNQEIHPRQVEVVAMSEMGVGIRMTVLPVVEVVPEERESQVFQVERITIGEVPEALA